MKRMLGWLMLLIVGVAIGVSLLPLIDAIRPEPGNNPTSGPFATAQVEKRTLREQVIVRAAVRRPPPIGIHHVGDGVVTEIEVEPGDVVDAGDVVFSLNDSPVIAVHGEVSFWRSLADGNSGPDVFRLEELLVEEGFLRSSDARYDTDTAQAVRLWRESLADPFASGEFDPGLVLTGPWPSMVVETFISTGQAMSAQEVLSVSPDEPELVVLLSANDLSRVSVGTQVAVDLPSGDAIDGTISRIAEVPSVDDSGGEHYEAIVSPDSPVNLPVGLQLRASVILAESRDVLAAPISAIVAGPDGDPALRVITSDGEEAVVKVELGTVETPWIEVRGDIDEGTTVVLGTR